jgi:phenylalanyl-tRNA synthetase beta chain
VLQDASGKILSMPPIINAAGIGEVTASTRNLFIDVTGILPKTVMETVNILAHNFLDTGARGSKPWRLSPPRAPTTPSLGRYPVSFRPST